MPAAAAGKAFVGINTTEPGGGSDLAKIKTRAERKGDVYVLTARRPTSRVPRSAPSSARPAVTARWWSPIPSPATRVSPSCGFPPICRRSLDVFTTTWAAWAFRLVAGYTRTRKSQPTACSGEEGRGFHNVMHGFNCARVLVAAACLGAAEKAIDISAEYNTQRKTFGKPLTNQERGHLLRDGEQLDAARHAETESAPRCVDAWIRVSRTPARSHAKTSTKSSRPVSASVRHWRTTLPRHGMIYHGAFGYTKDTPLEMALRGVMSYEVGAEGGLNIMRGIIARDLWGEAANPFKD